MVEGREKRHTKTRKEFYIPRFQSSTRAKSFPVPRGRMAILGGPVCMCVFLYRERVCVRRRKIEDKRKERLTLPTHPPTHRRRRRRDSLSPPPPTHSSLTVLPIHRVHHLEHAAGRPVSPTHQQGARVVQVAIQGKSHIRIDL